ncbi:hypothetical protein HID58_063730 [Brassica napus]|uniref:MATH domain-containing protein n=1 Tax=Brassica napus TaxID=3708 RepID=A0ABQ7XF13_BRANA|nr:hypothetical protein HID58_063730 [Brassica napus]
MKATNSHPYVSNPKAYLNPNQSLQCTLHPQKKYEESLQNHHLYLSCVSLSLSLYHICVFTILDTTNHDDVNTNLKEEEPYTVTGMRNRRPSTYSYKIETNVVDKFETRPFTRILHVYLNGNTKDGGAGYVSLYVEIDKSGFVDSAHQEVYADLRFYIFNRNERKYFTIQVGVDVIVPIPFEESETFSISSSSDKYTWTIQNFSTLFKDVYSPDIVSGSRWFWLRKRKIRFNVSSTLYNQRRAYEYIYVRTMFRVLNQQKLSNREGELRNWYGRTYIWGIVDLISFDDLRDSSKGFLVDDTLMVEVQLEAISTTKICQIHNHSNFAARWVKFWVFVEELQWLKLLLIPRKFRTGDEHQEYSLDHSERLLYFTLCSGNHSDRAVRVYTPNSQGNLPEASLSQVALMEMIQECLPETMKKLTKKLNSGRSRKSTAE